MSRWFHRWSTPIPSSERFGSEAGPPSASTGSAEGDTVGNGTMGYPSTPYGGSPRADDLSQEARSTTPTQRSTNRGTVIPSGGRTKSGTRRTESVAPQPW